MAAAAPAGKEDGTRQRRPRPRHVLPPRMAFLEHWRPFVVVRIDVPDSSRSHSFTLYPEEEALNSIDLAVEDIVMTSQHHKVHMNQVVDMIVPFNLAPDGRFPIKLLWNGGAPQSKELLVSLRTQTDEILSDIWARRHLATEQLADTLPEDVLRSVLAPYISYSIRQRNVRRRPSSLFQPPPQRRRRQSHRSQT